MIEDAAHGVTIQVSNRQVRWDGQRETTDDGTKSKEAARSIAANMRVIAKEIEYII
jgi:hypothetical protein